MSLHAMIWAYDQQLPCAHKFVLVTLADMSSDAAGDGEITCFPAQVTLANRCGLSRQHVNKIVADLERDGLITQIPRTRANGSARASEYRINCPAEDLPGHRAAVHREPPGFVYVFSCEGGVKVGIARNVEQRHKAIAQANPTRSVVISARFSLVMRDARLVEREAHRLLDEYKISNEWFRCSVAEAEAMIQKAIGVVSTEATPPLSSGMTGGVNTVDPLNLPPEPTSEAKASSVKRARRFADFWEQYPRKVGKRTAEPAFSRALKRATAEAIMAGLADQLPIWATDSPEFVPHPTTWLNRDGWLDQLTTRGQTNGSAPGHSATFTRQQANLDRSRVAADLIGEFLDAGGPGR